MLPTTKTLLTLTITLWAFIAALHNLLDWPGTLAAVQAATSMSTFEGGASSWQATSNPILIWLGALFILTGKLITGALCGLGTLRMWQHRSNPAAFAKAKEPALAGCAAAVVMLFGGFVLVGETWFELWRSDALRGPVLDSAFRYAALIALIGIFVAQPEPSGQPRATAE